METFINYLPIIFQSEELVEFQLEFNFPNENRANLFLDI